MQVGLVESAEEEKTDVLEAEGILPPEGPDSALLGSHPVASRTPQTYGLHDPLTVSPSLLTPLTESVSNLYSLFML